MNWTPRQDYVEAALRRLPRQFRDKPRLEALLSAFAEGAQDAEAGLLTLYSKRLLDTAEGAALDVYGRIVGEDRQGREDDSYRVRIRARQAVNRSSGTHPELLRLARLLCPQPLALRLEPAYPAALVLDVSDGELLLAEDVFAMLDEARAGGVALRMRHQDGPDAERFVTAGGVGLGFAGLPADYVGPREDVQPLGVVLGPVEDEAGSGGLTPVVSVVGTVPESLVGKVSLEVVDPSPDYTFAWAFDGVPTYANSSGQQMFPGGVEAPVELVDEEVVVGPVGLAAQWAEGDPYATGEIFSFSVSRVASTPPTLADAGAVAFTGQVRVEVVRGAPGYTFRYTLGSQAPRTTDMLRGTAVPLLLADGVTPSGLTVTWPDVTTHYPNASWAWRVAGADATVGGRFVSVRG